MDVLGTIHIGCATLALASGAAVILYRKGTAQHRRFGYLYSAFMIGLIATAFAIYDLFGTWGAFHWAAVIALVTLICGLVPVLRRHQRQWVRNHAIWMSWSYIGLVAALVAESLTRWVVPDERFVWAAVVLGSGLVIAAGAWVISARLPEAIASVRSAGRAP